MTSTERLNSLSAVGAPRADALRLAARALALYLPQFHPTPENDEWWGRGFTEWTNVARAKKRFPGHYQPHVPADLGFYDLRVTETLYAQADLAQRHGVEGFVFWHYWFGGRRMLEKPVDLYMAEGPDFGFALAWANQTWKGHWHGVAKQTLIEQTYPPGDDDRHFDALLPAFMDHRYIRVDGKPLLYIFRGEDLPDPRRCLEHWRQRAEQAGLPGLFLVAEVNDPLGRATYADPFRAGFDGGVDLRLPARQARRDVTAMRVLRKLGMPEMYRYTGAPQLRPAIDPAKPIFPSVMPGWDNTPRSGRHGVVVHGATPERFATHVKAAVENLNSMPASQRLLFVKSWNEWAEGNHMEPDQRYGTAFLEALRSGVGGRLRA